jgi:hypothetical protein
LTGLGLLAAALAAVASNHERLNGMGYPGMFPAEKIPLSSRIATSPDVFTALVSERSYGVQYGALEAVRLMVTRMQGAFDTDLLWEFVLLLGQPSVHGDRAAAYRDRERPGLPDGWFRAGVALRMLGPLCRRLWGRGGVRGGG